MEKIPVDKCDILQVAKFIPEHKWPRIAFELSIKEEEIELIKNSEKDCTTKFLTFWKSKKGESATFYDLINALKNLNLPDAAFNIQKLCSLKLTDPRYLKDKEQMNSSMNMSSDLSEKAPKKPEYNGNNAEDGVQDFLNLFLSSQNNDYISDFHSLFGAFRKGKITKGTLSACELIYVCKVCRCICLNIEHYLAHYGECSQSHNNNNMNNMAMSISTSSASSANNNSKNGNEMDCLLHPNLYFGGEQPDGGPDSGGASPVAHPIPLNNNSVFPTSRSRSEYAENCDNIFKKAAVAAATAAYGGNHPQINKLCFEDSNNMFHSPNFRNPVRDNLEIFIKNLHENKLVGSIVGSHHHPSGPQVGGHQLVGPKLTKSGKPRKTPTKKCPDINIYLPECNITEHSPKTGKPTYRVLFTDEEEKLMDTENSMCRLCAKKFNNNVYLQKHLAIAHLGYKRFKCKYCEFKTSSLPDCKLHMENFHPMEKSGMDFDKMICHLYCMSSSHKVKKKSQQQNNNNHHHHHHHHHGGGGSSGGGGSAGGGGGPTHSSHSSASAAVSLAVPHAPPVFPLRGYWSK